MTAFIYQELSDFARLIDEELARVDDANPESLAYILAAIRDLRADLAVTAGDVERRLLAAMGETKRFTVEGLGEIERRRAAKRTRWDSDALRAVVVARALDERLLNEQTGEFESISSAVSRVLAECARFEWRVTALRPRGIDPDEFCTTDYGEPSIALPPRKVQ